jgi:hypothetical protein
MFEINKLFFLLKGLHDIWAFGPHFGHNVHVWNKYSPSRYFFAGCFFVGLFGFFGGCGCFLGGLRGLVLLG